FQVDLPLEDVLNKSSAQSVAEAKSVASISTSEVSSSPSTPATSPSDSLKSSSPYYSATSTPEKKPPLCAECTQTKEQLEGRSLTSMAPQQLEVSVCSRPSPLLPHSGWRGREWPVVKDKATFLELLKPSLNSQKNVKGATAFLTSSDMLLDTCIKRIDEIKIFDECIKQIPTSITDKSLEPESSSKPSRLTEALFKMVDSSEVQNGLILLSQ
ncbi:unnamed protein product, partial [Meganyctiphanes norvegica]